MPTAIFLPNSWFSKYSISDHYLFFIFDCLREFWSNLTMLWVESHAVASVRIKLRQENGNFHHLIFKELFGGGLPHKESKKVWKKERKRKKVRKKDRKKEWRKERTKERKMTRMAGNLIFYRNRDATGFVSKFDISKLKDFHNAV